MAKYQRLSKRTSSLYDKIYGSGVFESMADSNTEEAQDLEEAKGGRMNLYQKIYGSKKIKEESMAEATLHENNDNSQFMKVKNWVEENEVNGSNLCYDGPYTDYIDGIYNDALDAANQQCSTNVWIEPSIQAGSGGVFMYDDEHNRHTSWDFELECEGILEYLVESESEEEFRNQLTGFFIDKIQALEDEEDDEYDDEF